MYLISLYCIYLQFLPSFGFYLTISKHTVITDKRNTEPLVEGILVCV